MSTPATRELETREKVRWGRILVLTGALLAIGCVVTVAWPENPVTNMESDWLRSNHKDVSVNLVVLIPAGIIACIGFLLLHDSKPIPNEFIPLPQAPLIPEDEPWRTPTGFRYLEKLKETCIELEKSIRASYFEALSAHRRLPDAHGYIEYKHLRSTVQTNSEYIARWETRASSIREHITKVFAGDVRADVLELEEQVAKLRLRKQHRESDLEEVKVRLQNADKNERSWIEGNKVDIRNDIKHIEMELVKVESTLKELREFDFGKLYKELGLSTESMRVDKERLAEIKNKAEILSEIKPQYSPGNKTEDEKKMDAAAQRIKHDIKFDVERRVGRKLTTLAAIQAFERTRSEEIKNDPTLSYDEKTEQLEQLKNDCEEHKKALKNEVNIYEDD